jgi:Ca-activated chloride channel family protein
MHKSLFSLIVLFCSSFALYDNTVSPKPFSEVKSGYLHFQFSPDNTNYLTGSNDTHFVFAQLKADAYNPVSSSRTPLNLCLVIDRSGSMSGDKLKYAKQAADFVVDQLKPEDFLSIVIYDSEVKTLLKSTAVSDKSHIHQLISTIQSGSSTNLSGGLSEGHSQVKANLKSGYVNRVLLMSDGLANAGIVEPERIKQLATRINITDGITTSSFGVGADFNEDLMMGIAESGSGNYYFIQNPDQIPDIFRKELNGLLQVVAQNAKVKVSLPEGVRLVQMYGYENVSTDLSNPEIILRDISSEDQKAFLMSYVLQPGTANPLNFKAVLSYADAVNGNGEISETLQFTVQPTDSKMLLDQNLDPLVIREYATFHANWLMQRAMTLVDQGNYTGARNLIDGSASLKYKYGATVTTDPRYMKQDSMMSNYKTKIKDYESMNDYDKKVLQKSNKSMNYEIQKKK